MITAKQQTAKPLSLNHVRILWGSLLLSLCLCATGCPDDDPQPICGDAVIEGMEVCDDGNTVSGDGCRDDCLSDETCGNELLDTAAGEACDSGRRGQTADCEADCSLPVCGDGLYNALAGEVCDDGNTVAGDGCNPTCTSDETCGNEITDPINVDGASEECDGGGVDTPACDLDCTEPICGDLYVNAEAGEECEAGGDTNTCDSDCTFPVCGDGHHNPNANERCDDGGSSADCDEDCTLVLCFDGVLNPEAGEVCELNDVGCEAGQTCSADCRSCT